MNMTSVVKIAMNLAEMVLNSLEDAAVVVVMTEVLMEALEAKYTEGHGVSMVALDATWRPWRYVQYESEAVSELEAVSTM